MELYPQPSKWWRLLGVGVVFVMLVISCLAVYGGIQLSGWDNRHYTMEQKEIKIEKLEQQVTRLRSLNKWIPVLEQILPPVSKAEMNFLAHKLEVLKRREGE